MLAADKDKQPKRFTNKFLSYLIHRQFDYFLNDLNLHRKTLQTYMKILPFILILVRTKRLHLIQVIAARF